MADLAGLGRADPFSRSTFGAEEIAGSRMHNPGGSIAHVEVRIGTSIVMRFDSYEGRPTRPGFFRLYLDDADASYEQALRAGATSVTEVTAYVQQTLVEALREQGERHD